jgi:CBS domain-containing protein
MGAIVAARGGRRRVWMRRRYRPRWCRTDNVRSPARAGGMIPGSTNQEAAMQMISEVMTRAVRTIEPDDTVRHAAQMMDELNVGSLPVCEGDRLIGMITDRDITIRSVAAGQQPDAVRVGDVMSTDVRTCRADQRVDEVLGQMGDVQIRRVPVIDAGTQRVIGIVSLGDLATQHAPEVDRALQEISEPAEPDQPRAH